VPAEHGGRGQQTAECLSVLEELAYTSLPLSLIAGINGALFLQPFSRYATDEVQAEVYHNVINRGALGGLMITEPDFGSDALNMQTAFRREGESYHLQGTKHWGGLTGHADYWLITARERTDEGRLGRNINFFVWDRSLGGIRVSEYYDSLGLAEIPYGRNEIDTTVPASRRLEPLSSGVRMLLDVLHRSRLQFPGMAMGFLRRILEEARAHVTRRTVGGHTLAQYDQVTDPRRVKWLWMNGPSFRTLFTLNCREWAPDANSGIPLPRTIGIVVMIISSIRSSSRNPWTVLPPST
jgi:alkylation response protein AidB-like acyl-CoA dehydrogenase